MRALARFPGSYVVVGLAWTLGTVACSTGDSGLSGNSLDGNSGGTSSGNGGSASNGTFVSGGSVSLSGNTTSTAGNAATSTTAVECMEGSSEDCTCPALTVAVIGKPGKWGANPEGDSDTAFQEWLNSSSSGTAQADVFSTKPTLTPEFLATYKVIVLASLSDDSNGGPPWTWDATEIAAFQDWIENGGGGVIALTGYSSNTEETTPVNQLTGFSGVTYNADDVSASCSNWTICGCAGSSTLSTWVTTDTVVSTLSTSVTLIGFEHGRSVAVPEDGHVAATVEANGTTAAVLVGKIAGSGRVLLYGDEWITYTSQWTGEGVDPAECTTGYYPQDAYQTAQFWFNMIKWVQPAATCFKIVNEEDPVTLW